MAPYPVSAVRSKMSVGGFALSQLPGLVLLLDAHKVPGAQGAALASVTDDLGTAFVQSEAAKKPTLQTGANGINGQSVIRFDGGDLLSYVGDLSAASQGTAFAVLRLTSTLVSYETVLSTADTATASYFWFVSAHYAAATPRMYVSQKNNDTSDRVDGSTVIADTTVYLMIWQSSGTAYAIRLNGADETLNIVTGANTGDWWGDTPNRDVWTIGALRRSTDDLYLKGDLALLGASSEVFDAGQIAQLEAYCRARFAINFP